MDIVISTDDLPIVNRDIDIADLMLMQLGLPLARINTARTIWLYHQGLWRCFKDRWGQAHHAAPMAKSPWPNRIWL